MKKVILIILLLILSINIVSAETDSNLILISGSEDELLYKINLNEEKVVDTGIEDKLGWTLYVDGYKVDKKTVNKNIGASLTSGVHTVYLKYEFPFIHEIIITLCVFMGAFSLKKIFDIIKEKETL